LFRSSKIKITVNTAGDLTGLDFNDRTNSRTLSIRPADPIENGDIILIDPSVPSVTLNNERVKFSGMFPDFQPGTSDIAVFAYTSTGLAVDQEQVLSNTQVNLFKTSTVIAQQFKTGALPGPISRVQLAARKFGNPAGDITVDIRADSSDDPTGASQTSVTVPAAS